jgi:hypothetical protein
LSLLSVPVVESFSEVEEVPAWGTRVSIGCPPPPTPVVNAFDDRRASDDPVAAHTIGRRCRGRSPNLIRVVGHIRRLSIYE